MKGFAVFLTVVLSIYVLVNAYIFMRGSKALALKGWQLWAFRAVFLALVLCYPLGRIIRVWCVCEFERILIIIGSWWLGAMFYLFIAVAVIDILALINGFLHLVPAMEEARRLFFGRILALCVSVLVLSTLLYGYFNALNIRVTDLTMEKQNRLYGLGIRGVMVSDIHLGIMVDQNRFGRLVESINEISPDIIFIVGDLFDENVETVKEMSGLLAKLKAPLGKWFVTGNHEYYTGVENALRLIEEAGVNVLSGEYQVIAGKFNLIGVDDNTAVSYGKRVIPLEELSRHIDNGLPNVYLYHKPVGLERAASLGMDLALSGHIHGGQLWPVKYLTDLIFRLKSRDFTLGGMRVFISNGAGTWGPPMRVGAYPEIVHIHF